MKKTRKSIVKRLDTVFSLYIRLRYSDNEIVECFTCGKQSHFKRGMQCGHFMSRKHYATRWDATNCQVQCYACNVIAEDLLQKSRTTVKYSNEDLESMILYYNNLVNQLI